MWFEIYQHEDFGEIVVTWNDRPGTRAHLTAIQGDLWTPAEELADCVRWAQSLQDDYMARDGDGEWSLSSK